jgi:hypothetical protein
MLQGVNRGLSDSITSPPGGGSQVGRKGVGVVDDRFYSSDSSAIIRSFIRHL